MALNHAAVLVVEDEPFIALDLALAIEDAGGMVIGPAASVKEALAFLETQLPAGAILDVNLTDGDIWPVVDFLVGHRIPLLIQTGVGLPADVASRYSALVVLIKPTMASTLVAKLQTLLAAQYKGHGASNLHWLSRAHEI